MSVKYTPLFKQNNNNRCKIPLLWIKSCTILLIFIVSFYVVNYLPHFQIANKFQPINYNLENNNYKGFLVYTTGCRIPDMNPLDKSVKEFIFPPKSLNCLKSEKLFSSNLTMLYLTEKFEQTFSSKYNCCYQELKRETEQRVNYTKNCIQINGNVKITNEEFLRVQCKDLQNNSVIYEEYFSFVPPKIQKIKPKKDSTNSIRKLNFLFIGLDAISRLNLHRQLPKTLNYLKTKLQAVELFGYNKVADNTFPNLIPVLTGLFEHELQQHCWPNQTSYFDDCPFLWKEFKKQGYLTALAEDCSWIGLFNYVKNGFNQQPTDYYYSNFNRESESRIGHKTDFNCVQCVGNREAFKLTFEYIKKFVQRMVLENNSPYFGFFWSNSLSHDYLNRPALGDEDLTNLFTRLEQWNVFKNTVLIFMSDHGIRWGDIRETYQGQLEERLPFVFLSIPEWWKENNPMKLNNLKMNAHRLTTPFDLYATIKEFAEKSYLINNSPTATNTVSASRRGYSLFEKIPKNRTCTDAEIESHWCTCQQSVSIDKNSEKVIAAANFAVKFINQQLLGYVQCANLKLYQVLAARVLTYDEKHIRNGKNIQDYTLTLETVPGEGIFEVTVRSNDKEQKESQEDNNDETFFHITGTISRINSYGKQSSCITDFHLKLYCYCL